MRATGATPHPRDRHLQRVLDDLARRSRQANAGRVTTVERIPAKAALARGTLARAGGIAPVTLEVGDGGEFLAHCGRELDFISHSNRTQYAAWWPDIRRALAPGGLLVVDNATSHPDEVRAAHRGRRRVPRVHHCTRADGKGEFLAHKGV